MEITKENIILRSKTFGKYYAIINKMLSQSGFGWDWDNHKISVDSEDVWNKHVMSLQALRKISVVHPAACLRAGVLKSNKNAASYRHKVIKFWDKISLVYSKYHANRVGARTASEYAKEMVVEHGNNNNNNKDNDVASSTQAKEDHKRKRYRSDDSIACMLGENLANFTSAYKDDACEPPSKLTSPEEILVALEAIPRLEENELLVAYDILVSNDLLA